MALVIYLVSECQRLSTVSYNSKCMLVKILHDPIYYSTRIPTALVCLKYCWIPINDTVLNLVDDTECPGPCNASPDR